MEIQETQKIVEQLYAFAQKNGQHTTSNDSSRSKGPNTGYGSRNNRYHYAVVSGGFVIKATEDEWVRWTPTQDSSGTERILEILRGDKTVFFAKDRGDFHAKNFSLEGEHYKGDDYKESKGWEIVKGKLPKKYYRGIKKTEKKEK